MNSLMIDCSVVTVCRKVNYIESLIGNLPQIQPIRIFVGSPATDYLLQIKGNGIFEINAPDPDDWEAIKNQSVFQRATWNYWRALAFVPDNMTRHGLLVLEDDVLPAIGWFQHLQAAVAAINQAEPSDYILALYSSRRHVATKGPKPYTLYPTHLFAGTQAIYYPERVRQDFATFLRKYGVEMNEAPYDMLLAEYAERKNIEFYLTVPVLVQHIGKTGTGLSEFHEAPDFQPDLTSMNSFTRPST